MKITFGLLENFKIKFWHTVKLRKQIQGLIFGQRTFCRIFLKGAYASTKLGVLKKPASFKELEILFRYSARNRSHDSTFIYTFFNYTFLVPQHLSQCEVF